MPSARTNTTDGPLSRWIRFCLEQKLVVALLTLFLIAGGLIVAPFAWDLPGLPRERVPVDAIPDIGENQQIVFTEWPGRSPQDVDDQITYPLTVALLGIPGVKDVRSQSAFGFSSVYVVFEDGVDFYWSRARIIEKLNSLPAGTLPQGVSPALGPDATALGQVFWYTLEGRDEQGDPAGGWDLQELRTIQDFVVRYKLASVEGVAEVASIGGHVREYQVDVDPDAMRAAGVSLHEVIDAVRRSNIDVGARTLEVNRVEYVVRGLGFIESVEDLEQTAVGSRDGVPVLLEQIAHVGTGPALRRGALTREGVEAVGGVVVVRHGANPMATIERVKERIEAISSGLPSRTLEDGRESRVTITPFYDRTGLIRETLGTLNAAIGQQVLVTIAVVVLMLFHLRSSLLISSMLPLAVLATFVGMKALGVDANVVALSGIAIAIGTIVDMGIVLCENVVRRLNEAEPGERTIDVVHRASVEVGGAVGTAALTTVVSFLPVFALQGAEGRLFTPLAWTKTLALVASIVIALTILPAAAHALFGWRTRWPAVRRGLSGALVLAGIGLVILGYPAYGAAVIALGLYHLIRPHLPPIAQRSAEIGASVLAAVVVVVILADAWAPAGIAAGLAPNALLIALAVGGLLLAFWLFRLAYPRLLGWALRHKFVALSPALVVVLLGLTVWLGFGRVWGWLPEGLRKTDAAVSVAHAFPGLGEEFMPSLDEGAFLYMPTTMPHASIGEALDVVKTLDRRIMSVPEVEIAVGKIGRVDSPLDPAPLSMVETVVQYKSEFRADQRGRVLTFEVDPETGDFVRDEQGNLIENPRGEPYRQWRDHIESPQDIWDAIVDAAQVPGVTSAPKLQPIETRVVMLQSGFRAPMGVKVFGPDLETIDAFARDLESILKRVPSVAPAAVFADRVVGKPYMEIGIDREAIARYGLHVADVQEVIEVAIGGKPLTTTVEGRERYPVRVRYLRERRDDLETLGSILVPTPDGAQVPLRELASIGYRRGPQMIRSEDTFLVSYVLFDKRAGEAEVDVVEDARRAIEAAIDGGRLDVPAGVSWAFAGSYQNQVRAAKRLTVVVPAALAAIFLLIYFQFRRVSTTLFVFCGVFVAWGGGFLLLWLYGRPWFLDASLFGLDLRETLQVEPVNLSVAVWVGFLALFGIATDDGVVMATRIDQSLEASDPSDVEGVRAAVLDGATLRIRAALMTTATTILALLPVLTSTGKGSDIMVPMAVPIVGGMLVAVLTVFVVPVLVCWTREARLRLADRAG